MSDNYVDVEGEVIHETVAAVLLKVDNKEVWLPFSQIECEKDWEQDGAPWRTYSLPEWLAIEKELE